MLWKVCFGRYGISSFCLTSFNPKPWCARAFISRFIAKGIVWYFLFWTLLSDIVRTSTAFFTFFFPPISLSFEAPKTSGVNKCKHSRKTAQTRPEKKKRPKIRTFVIKLVTKKSPNIWPLTVLLFSCNTSKSKFSQILLQNFKTLFSTNSKPSNKS